jgi:hypothetical protein
MIKPLRIFILCLILSTNISGQTAIFSNILWPETTASQNDMIYQLELSHAKRKKIKHITEGRKITLIIDSIKIKGKIDSISSGQIFINEKGYSVEKIDAIRINLRGFRYGGAGTLLGGVGLSVLGIIITSSGLALASSDLMMVFIGAALAGFGITLMGIGGVAIIVSIPMFFIGKKFDFHKKWHLTIVPVDG